MCCLFSEPLLTARARRGELQISTHRRNTAGGRWENGPMIGPHHWSAGADARRRRMIDTSPLSRTIPLLWAKNFWPRPARTGNYACQNECLTNVLVPGGCIEGARTRESGARRRLGDRAIGVSALKRVSRINGSFGADVASGAVSGPASGFRLRGCSSAEPLAQTRNAFACSSERKPKA